MWTSKNGVAKGIITFLNTVGRGSTTNSPPEVVDLNYENMPRETKIVLVQASENPVWREVTKYMVHERKNWVINNISTVVRMYNLPVVEEEYKKFTGQMIGVLMSLEEQGDNLVKWTKYTIKQLARDPAQKHFVLQSGVFISALLEILMAERLENGEERKDILVLQAEKRYGKFVVEQKLLLSGDQQVAWLETLTTGKGERIIPHHKLNKTSPTLSWIDSESTNFCVPSRNISNYVPRSWRYLLGKTACCKSTYYHLC